MMTAPQPDFDPTLRIAEREAEVERWKTHSAKQLKMCNELMDAMFGLMLPPSEEELHDMMHGPRGQDLREVIAELERQ